MSDPTQPVPAPKGRGCFFYGCLTCVILLIIASVSGFFIVRYAKNQLSAYINTYTDSAPVTLPKVEMDDREFKQLEERVKTFNDAMGQGKATEALVLTEREVNALIARTAEAKPWADKVYLSVEGDQVKGQVSIPLTQLGWLSKGRYLNGEATFKVSLENGALMVKASDIQVKGKPLPETLMEPLRQENLAKDAATNPKNAEAIRKYDSIQIQDSRVIIKAKAVTP